MNSVLSVQATAEAPARPGGGAAPAPAPRRRRPILLIVADAALRQQLAAGARVFDFDVVEGDLRSALVTPDAGAENRLAAIVVDVDLQAPDSREALTALKTRATGRGVPILTLCPSGDSRDVAAANSLGLIDVVTRTEPAPLILYRLAQAVRTHEMLRTWRTNDAQRRQFYEAYPDALLRVDANGSIREVLCVGTTGVGLAIDSHGVGRRLDDLLPPPRDTTFAEQCARAIQTRQVNEHHLVRTDGDGIVAIDIRIAPLGADRALVMLRDETGSREIANDARRTLFYDSLTGLPNRALFMSRLSSAITDDAPPKSSVAVVRLQVDQFRRVDTALGPGIADELLAEVGRRLVALVEGGASETTKFDGSLALAARIDADGFAVLAVGLRDRKACEDLAERVREPLCEPIHLADREIRSTFSIGISLWPENGEDAETLLRNAALAANDARADGTARLFTDTLRMRSLRGLDIEQQLRQALEGDELSLAYQPKIDIERKRLVGFEALLRWETPDLGRVSPAEIIPVAEQSGLILPLGEWALQRALSDSIAFQDPAAPNTGIAINVSALQFANRQFVPNLQQSLQRMKIRPAMVELELTESVLMKDAAKAMRVLSELRALGVRLSIDDFGTGFSSLQYLRRLPVNALKIDASFVKDIPHDRNAYSICSAVIALGRSLGLEVIAEGVENSAQAQALKARGCTQMQGYLIGRPMPVASVAQWMRRAEWRTVLERANEAVSTDY